jgi:hypothetical protein
MSDGENTTGSADDLLAAALRFHRPVDPTFADPFIDVDEAREQPEPHRYVHGGFTGTDLRFSYYFPPAARYDGRFLHVLPPISGFEHGAGTELCYGTPGSIGFAFDTGAYLVESNMGRTSPAPGPDPTIPGFRASAAAARFSRAVALAIYGGDRPKGYVYGGSGGAFKTIACFENAPGVWDGAVPFVQGSPIAIPNCFAVQARAMQVLRDVLARITDALEPGGSGDMYAGLTVVQREALAEVTRFGFPPGAWFDVDRIRSGYTTMWSVFAEQIRAIDPDYFHDFWTTPGYLGADAPQEVTAGRVRATLRVTDVILAGDAERLGVPVPMAMAFDPDAAVLPIAVRVEGLEGIDPFGAMLEVTSGAAAGRRFYVSAVVGDIVATGMSVGSNDGLRGVAAGDEVTVNNDDFIAFQTFPRHQVMDGFDGFDQYIAAGHPIYPQRPLAVGPLMTRGTWGHHQTGHFAGKMICLSSLLDEAAYPWQAAWYQRRVRAARGDRTGEHHRLWFVENAMHGPSAPVVVNGPEVWPSPLTRTVGYVGALEQAIRDVIAWVEHDIPPAPDTEFELVDAQVVVPDSAAIRGGIQPTVRVTANGRDRVEVAPGEEVTFVGEAEVPPGAGVVVAAEWDFLGDGTFPVRDPHVRASHSRVTVRQVFRFDTPGTYFPALRITSHRKSDPATPYARVQNLGRVRVVVQ